MNNFPLGRAMRVIDDRQVGLPTALASFRSSVLTGGQKARWLWHVVEMGRLSRSCFVRWTREDDT